MPAGEANIFKNHNLFKKKTGEFFLFHTTYKFNTNEDEVNEIFDILNAEAKLDYENLYEGFEEMMCASKPGKELLLRILTRTMKEAAKQLEKIIQEER